MHVQLILYLCWLSAPGDRLNIKMSSYQYRDPHVKDKTVSRPSYLLHWNPIPGKDGLYFEAGPWYPTSMYKHSLWGYCSILSILFSNINTVHWQVRVLYCGYSCFSVFRLHFGYIVPIRFLNNISVLMLYSLSLAWLRLAMPCHALSQHSIMSWYILLSFVLLLYFRHH